MHASRGTVRLAEQLEDAGQEFDWDTLAAVGKHQLRVIADAPHLHVDDAAVRR